jgi:protein-tyrosine-phosphatase
LHEVPYTGGASSFRESCQAEELVHLGETLLDAVEYDGVAMVEFRRAAIDGRPYFLEINGRLWGSLALALHCGVDFPAALVQCYQYGSPVRGESPYRAGVRCRSVFPGEVGHLVSIFRARTSREAGPAPSKVKAVVRFILLSLDPRIRHDHFWWSDPLPGIRQAWKTISAMGRTSFRKGYEKLENYRDRRMLKRLREEHESRLRRPRYFEMPPRRVLFVCYGNICRSPFAAEYWNGRLRERAPTLPPAVSAGLHPVPGRRTPDYLTEAAQVYDVDLRRHESRVVLRSDVDSADAIFAMDRMNYRSLMRQFPDVKDRTYFLGLFGDTGDSEIGDPYNKGKASARACCDQLVSSLEGLSAKILRG